MDDIFNPKERKWIAGPVILKDMITKVRESVRLERDKLFVVDPTASGAPPEGQSEEHSEEFLPGDAVKLDEEKILNLRKKANNDGNEANESKDANKWTPSDEICEAAVKFVGGEDFFLFGKKKTNTGEKKQRGRKTKKSKEVEEEEGEEVEVLGEEQESRREEPSVDASNEEIMEMSEAKKEIDTAEATCTNVLKAAGLFDEESDSDGWLDYDPEIDCDFGNNDFANANDSDGSDQEEDTGRMLDSDDEALLSEQEDEPGTVYLPGEDAVIIEPSSYSDSIPQFTESELLGATNSAEKNFYEMNTESVDERVLSEALKSQDDKSGSQRHGGTLNNTSGSQKPEQPPSNNARTRDSIAEFKKFTEWVFDQTLQREDLKRDSLRKKVAEEVNLPEDVVDKRQKLTSASLCTVKGEVFQDEPVMQSSSMPMLAPPAPVTAQHGLQSLAIFLSHGEDPSCFPWKSINVQQQMNDDFLNHQYLKRMQQQERDIHNPSLAWDLVNKEEDFLVEILIYQATDPEDVLPDEIKAYSQPRLAYEIHMLGSQTVQDLMSAFHCENDYLCLRDIPHPDAYKEKETSENFAKAHFPNSMILIHETIYARPDCDIDYTGIVNAWASKRPAKNIRTFKRGDWNTQLKDLELSFGYPYVYIHLGGCEHIYVFTKARLLNKEDHHLKSSYPNIIGQTRFKNVYCRVDNEYLARWAVVDFKELPENPMLLCTECVHMYCYDKSKKKRDNFKLYPFTQMANIL